MKWFTLCPKKDIFGMVRGVKKLLFIKDIKISGCFGTEGKIWTAFRNLIFYERGCYCSSCNIRQSYKKLHIHHIKPISKYPALIFDKNNCVVLCKECHKKQHHSRWAW